MEITGEICGPRKVNGHCGMNLLMRDCSEVEGASSGGMNTRWLHTVHCIGRNAPPVYGFVQSAVDMK